MLLLVTLLLRTPGVATVVVVREASVDVIVVGMATVVVMVTMAFSVVDAASTNAHSRI